MNDQLGSMCRIIFFCGSLPVEDLIDLQWAICVWNERDLDRVSFPSIRLAKMGRDLTAVPFVEYSRVRNERDMTASHSEYSISTGRDMTTSLGIG